MLSNSWVTFLIRLFVEMSIVKPIYDLYDDFELRLEFWILPSDVVYIKKKLINLSQK